MKLMKYLYKVVAIFIQAILNGLDMFNDFNTGIEIEKCMRVEIIDIYMYRIDFKQFFSAIIYYNKYIYLK